MSARPLSWMHPTSFLLFPVLLACAGACSPDGGPPAGEQPAQQSPGDGDEVIRVQDPRLYLVPGGASGAIYMDIAHSGSDDDRLLRAEVEGVQSVQTHESIEGQDGVIRMRGAPDGFALPAGSVLQLKRGGKHIMLLGISRPLPQVGEEVPAVLHFEKAGTVTLKVPVRAYGE